MRCRPRLPSPTVAALAAVLLLTACFDPPVRETVELRFLPHGEYVVTSRVEITEPEKTGNRALERRLAEVRRALAQEDDDWSRRFAALAPAAERFAWEKHLGALHRVERSAVLDEPAQLAAFFADTSLAVSYEVRDGLGELAVVPGPADRATLFRIAFSAARTPQAASEERVVDPASAALGGLLSDSSPTPSAPPSARSTPAGLALPRRLAGHPRRERPQRLLARISSAAVLPLRIEWSMLKYCHSPKRPTGQMPCSLSQARITPTFLAWSRS